MLVDAPLEHDRRFACDKVSCGLRAAEPESHPPSVLGKSQRTHTQQWFEVDGAGQSPEMTSTARPCCRGNLRNRWLSAAAPVRRARRDRISGGGRIPHDPTGMARGHSMFATVRIPECSGDVTSDVGRECRVLSAKGGSHVTTPHPRIIGPSLSWFMQCDGRCASNRRKQVE